LDYALTLDIPFVFSSNGDGFVFHDRTGLSAQRETALQLEAFPGHRPLGEIPRMERAGRRAGKDQGLTVAPAQKRVAENGDPSRY
jgi:type I site-specific restriction endonuclease